MEDYFELLIFLLFAAFSLLSRFLNPKKKPPSRSPEDYQSPEYEEVSEPEKPVVDWEETPKKKPVTFEEILREMMGESSARPSPSPQPKMPRKVKETRARAEQKVKEAQQNAKKAQRITDKISLEDSGKRIEAIEIVDQKNSVAREVAEALSNPKSAREAIILSEIINRKYF